MRVDRIQPEALTITDLDVDKTAEEDGELKTIALAFNPETIERQIGANYVAHSPIGYSGQIMQFVGNTNQTFDLEVFYHALEAKEYEELTVARNFCESLLYSSSQAATIATNAPPRILVFWPNNLGLQCRVKSARIRDDLYDPDGRILQFTAVLTLFEVVDRRMNKESIKKVGPQRQIVVEI